MSSGFADAAIAGVLLLVASAAQGADLDELLRSLAREPPQTTAFVEVHRSALLDRDLVVSGELEYRGPGRLSRVVSEPYRERTVVDGTDVSIQREGRPERRFSLRRSAELGRLMAAFSALLAGDRKALDAAFEPRVEFRPDGWRLELVPRMETGEDSLEKIVVHGVDDTPACIALWSREGEMATVIRLGAATAETARLPADECRLPDRDP